MQPRILVLILLSVLSVTLSARALSQEQEQLDVSLPVKFDYPLLRKLLEKQLFTGAGNTFTVLSDAASCNELVLSDPRLSPDNAHIEIIADASAKVGVRLFARCFTFINWNGSVNFLGLPVVKKGGASVGLTPQDVWLTNADGSRLTSGLLWSFARAPVQDLFSGFTLDLSPFTETLNAFLPDVLHGRSQTQAQNILDSVELRSLEVAPDSLHFDLGFTVAALDEPQVAEAALSPEELHAWELRWQTMDALLVFAVKHYAAATQMQELRSTLLEVLIDSRYQLVEALTLPADSAHDPVRTWFVDSWQQLNPAVRKIALEQEGSEHLLWLSVMAATDALYALDQLGPQFGFQISMDGIRRLARLINQGVDMDDLLYSEEVDPQLQELFQQKIELRAAPEVSWRFNFFPIMSANAAGAEDDLHRWLPKKGRIGEYVPVVSKLLDESSDGVLQKYQLDSSYEGLFKDLVLATAWQESCWRQFVVKDGRIEPLLSSTGDVGIMQMNERVWRGFYDLQKLRWDVTYNSRAGTEVLLDYLQKYAIRKEEHRRSGGIDNLARASYSAYNGGPSKVARYRSTDVTAYQKKVDTAFWAKYQKIKVGQRAGIARCLGAAPGEVAG